MLHSTKGLLHGILQIIGSHYMFEILFLNELHAAHNDVKPGARFLDLKEVG